MKDIIKAGGCTYEVRETPRQEIFICGEVAEERIWFADRQAFYQFWDQVSTLIPRPKQTNLENTYVGEKWKYDI